MKDTLVSRKVFLWESVPEWKGIATRQDDVVEIQTSECQVFLTDKLGLELYSSFPVLELGVCFHRKFQATPLIIETG